jgi:hypothetical protein
LCHRHYRMEFFYIHIVTGAMICICFTYVWGCLAATSTLVVSFVTVTSSGVTVPIA